MLNENNDQLKSTQRTIVSKEIMNDYKEQLKERENMKVIEKDMHSQE
jgi:hypothetical protein